MVRGHPALRIVGKGGKPATIPSPRRVNEMLRDMQLAARHSDQRVTAGYDRGRTGFNTYANDRIAADLLDDST